MAESKSLTSEAHSRIVDAHAAIGHLLNEWDYTWDPPSPESLRARP